MLLIIDERIKIDFHGRRARGELRSIAGERIEDANWDVVVAIVLQEEDSIERVEDAMIREKREPGADEDPSREIEES